MDRHIIANNNMMHPEMYLTLPFPVSTDNGQLAQAE